MSRTWSSLKLISSFAVDASSASEDDLDSEDSEQEIKSCSHCGTTSEYTSLFVIYHSGQSSVFNVILMFKPFNMRKCLKVLETVRETCA